MGVRPGKFVQFWKTPSESDDFRRAAHQATHLFQSIEQDGWVLDIKAPVLNNSRLQYLNNSDLR